jgi:tetratricopeptide (TPR) repeat protein
MMNKVLLAVAVAALSTQAWAIKGTLVTATEKLNGDIKWQSRGKMYTVEMMRGKTPITMERKLQDVIRLEIPVPPGYEKAVSQVESGVGQQAVAALTKIVADYRMLIWDKPAGRYLALAHLAAGNVRKALDICNGVVADDKSAAYMGDIAPAYWQALLKLGRIDQLEGLLKKAAACDDRASSAAALVMRGDIIVSTSNDAPDKLRQALTDGYLRVVLLYQDAACRRERKEALVKAATIFDKLGQSSRAEMLRAESKKI